MKYALLALLLILTACSRPWEQRDIAECKRIGFQEKTEGMGQCLLKLREIRASKATTTAIWSSF